MEQGGETLPLLEYGKAPRIPQCEKEATYAPKITKEDALINWSKPREQIHNQVRALNPSPGAYTFLGGKILKIWQVSPVDEMLGEGETGCVVQATKSSGIIVQAGDGLLRIDSLQLEGRRKLSGVEFLRGYEFDLKTVLGR